MSGIAVSDPASKEFKITPEWFKSAEKRIAKKAGLKLKGGNTYGCKDWGTKISQFLGDGRSAGVVGKGYHESNHYVQAALLRRQFEAGGAVDLAQCIDDQGVKDRVYREDYIRFRPEMFRTSESNPVSKRNQMASRLSRAAHYCHGACEFMAAPTGFLQNTFKNLTTPNANLKGTTNRLGMVASLPLIGVLTGVITMGLNKIPDMKHHAFGLTLGASAINYSVGTFAMAYSGLSAFFGGAGAISALASQAALSKDKLTDHQKGEVLKDHELLLTKIDALLMHFRRGSQGHVMVSRALSGKIGAAFRDSKTGEPELLKALTLAHEQSADQATRFKNISRVIGQYLSVPERTGVSKSGPMGTLRNYQHARALLARESHFVALCDLIDHTDLKAAPETAVDLRRAAESSVEKLHRTRLVPGAQKALRFMPGFRNSGLDKHLTARQHEDYKKQQDKKFKTECLQGQHISSVQRVLDLHHQYSKPTVFCARVGEALRRVSLDIVLAQNAQLSRLFFNVFYRINKLISTSPASRTINMALGRFAGGAVLTALMATLTFVTAGALNGLHIPVIAGTGLKMGTTTFSFLAAGVMMFACNLIGLGFTLTAKLIAANGGYKGGSAKPRPSALEDPKAAGWNQNSRLNMVKSSNLKPLYRLMPGTA